MLRIALCEDNPAQSETVRQCLDAYRAEHPGVDMEVHAFSDGNQLLEKGKHVTYHLFLLDIIMPGMDGIELARRLRAADGDAAFIFLTASADYALEAFAVSASQYLLKPVDRTALFAALDRVFAAQERDRGRFIMVPTRDRTERVAFLDIVYVELSGRTLRVCVDGGEYVSKTVRVPFAEAVAPLLEDDRFLYAHKSYVLNMARVRALTPRSFVMENNDEIPVPRHKYAEAKNRYFDYLSSRGIGLLGGDHDAH